MRCVSDAFSGGAVLAAAPVNHDYNGEERRRRRCRKSCGDNYNARDKIMGTRRARPIIPCISSRVTSPPHRPPLLTTRNQGSRSPKPRRIHLEVAACDQTPLPGAAQVEGAPSTEGASTRVTNMTSIKLQLKTWSCRPWLA